MVLLLRALLVGTLLALFVRTYLLQPYRVPSDSMTPGLLPGDHVVVDRFIFGGDPFKAPWLPSREPRRFDVMVVSGPDGRRLIKRCLGLPGELIEMVGYRVLVDGRPVEENASYLSRPAVLGSAAAREGVPANFGPLRLAAEQFLFLGDHREVSLDSRKFGPLRRQDIIGRAFLIYWSIPLEIGGTEGDSFDKIPANGRAGPISARWNRCLRPLR